MTHEEQALDPSTPPDVLEKFVRTNQDLARLVAQNPAAPPALLEKLARRSWAFAELVARNPNIPRALYLRLALYHTEAFLQNPLFSLMLLENPRFWLELPIRVLHKLIQSPLVSVSELSLTLLPSYQKLSQELKLRFARHPDTHPDFLIRLAGDRSVCLRRQVRKHPRLPELFRLLSQLCPVRVGDSYKASKRENSNKEKDHVTLTPEQLRLAAAGGPWTRILAAALPETPPEVLCLLLDDPYWEVPGFAAQNPSTPREKLLSLAENSRFHDYLPLNPKCPQSLLRTLWEKYKSPVLSHGTFILLSRLATNPSTPPEILSEMARMSARLRPSLLENRSLPIEDRQRLEGTLA